MLYRLLLIFVSLFWVIPSGNSKETTEPKKYDKIGFGVSFTPGINRERRLDMVPEQYIQEFILLNQMGYGKTGSRHRCLYASSKMSWMK